MSFWPENTFRSRFAALLASACLAGPGHANEDLSAAIGGFLGAVVGSQLNENRSAAAPARQSAPRQTAAPRRVVTGDPVLKEIQIRLNAFGCDAGSADGLIGQKTRSAIRCFQERSRQPITGQLTDQERAYLLSYTPELPGQKPDEDSIVIAPAEPIEDETKVSQQPLQPSNNYDTDNRPTEGRLNAAGLPDLSLPIPSETSEVCDKLSDRLRASESVTGSANLVPVMTRYCEVRRQVVTAGEQQLSVYQANARQRFWEQCQNVARQLGKFSSELGEIDAESLSSRLSASLSLQQTPGAEQYQLCVSEAMLRDSYEVSRAGSLLLFAMGVHGYGELVAADLALGLSNAEVDVEGALNWYETTALRLDAGSIPIIDIGTTTASQQLRSIAKGITPAPDVLEISTVPSLFISSEPLFFDEVARAEQEVLSVSLAAKKDLEHMSEFFGHSVDEMERSCEDALIEATAMPLDSFQTFLLVKTCNSAAHAASNLELAVAYGDLAAEMGDGNAAETSAFVRLIIAD